jgi:hypothetical protein
MNWLKRSVISLLSAVVLCRIATAQVSTNPTNPYQAIPRRNIFGLRPEPTAVPSAPPIAAPEIILTGLTTITGSKLALLKLEFPAKPSQRQREESCILREGDKDGPVQVLQIDIKKETVKVDNSGKVSWLTFQKNGPKSKLSSPLKRRTAMPIPVMR